jgi:hypothetical protein
VTNRGLRDGLLLQAAECKGTPVRETPLEQEVFEEVFELGEHEGASKDRKRERSGQ